MFDTSTQALLSHFPHETPREGQLDAAKFVLDTFNSGKKFAILEAPTGAGKSAIAAVVAGYVESSFYLTISKVLQDQLSSDFGQAGSLAQLMVDLKGRGSYECPWRRDNVERIFAAKGIAPRIAAEWRNRRYNCNQGYCREKGKEEILARCKQAGYCPYFRQVDQAIKSSCCLMNFSSFLYQRTYTKRFPSRKLMVIDEGHNIESQLLDFVSLSLTQDNIGTTMPKLDTPEEYAIFFAEKNVEMTIMRLREQAADENDFNRMDELDNTLSKLRSFMVAMTGDNPELWVSEYFEIGHRVQLKPVYVHNYANKYLFDAADNVLIMSATILDVNVMARALGIKREQLAAKRMRSRFPVEHHPIYYRPAGKFTGGRDGFAKWGPVLLKAVDEIVAKYPGKKGIIHTHNMAIAKLLMQSSKHVSRFLFQEDFRDKTEMLLEHDERADTVIVAPAMHEGIDLKDDRSRFQILCKVPFPNFYEDKQLAMRKEDDPQFYNWLTALKLVQSVGRSIRSKDDWADTYIIDESFKVWYHTNKAMLPEWFKNAVQWH